MLAKTCTTRICVEKENSFKEKAIFTLTLTTLNQNQMNQEFNISFKLNDEALKLKGECFTAQSMEEALKKFREKYPAAIFVGATNNTVK